MAFHHTIIWGFIHCPWDLRTHLSSETQFHDRFVLALYLGLSSFHSFIFTWSYSTTDPGRSPLGTLLTDFLSVFLPPWPQDTQGRCVSEDDLGIPVVVLICRLKVDVCSTQSAQGQELYSRRVLYPFDYNSFALPIYCSFLLPQMFSSNADSGIYSCWLLYDQWP